MSSISVAKHNVKDTQQGVLFALAAALADSHPAFCAHCAQKSGSHSSQSRRGARSPAARRRILAAGEYPSAEHSSAHRRCSGLGSHSPLGDRQARLSGEERANLRAQREYPSAAAKKS